MSVPSILEEISLLPAGKGIDTLAPLLFVAFGGGPLKPMVGEKLAAGGVKLLNHFGSTESGPLASVFSPKPDYDWHYFRLRKDMDLQILPAPLVEDGVQRYTLITHPFGWKTAFTLQDQLICNPRNPSSDFSAIGRNDDLIVLATGEKITPRILETMLFESELVTTAIAFGDGQFEPGVVIQPSSFLTLTAHEEFKSSIWSIIVEAGGRMDAHARVSSKDAIIVVPFETTLPRSDKGSIMRKEVYKMFESEIAEAYRNLENSISDNATYSLSLVNLEADLKSLIQHNLTWRVPAEQWTLDDEFFELGMDSLQAVQLRRLLVSSLPRSATAKPATDRISRDFVYRYPSITQLANALKASADLPMQDSLIGEFADMFSIKRAVGTPSKPEQGSVILLTGGTGSLGSHVLAHLASLPGVTRVICLNRHNSNADAFARQLEAIQSKCIAIGEEAWSKIEVLQSNAALPFLGLTEAEYAHVRGRVTHIFHNAWPMDFNMKLPSFKLQFQILQNLLNLAREAHLVHPLIRPRLLFVSSISVVGRYPLVRGEQIVPEISVIDGEKCTNQIGYAQAKLVCEKMLEKAKQEFADELEVAYVRVGQMSGSKKNGYWNIDEHLPAMFKSSQAVGSLPCLEGVIKIYLFLRRTFL